MGYYKGHYGKYSGNAKWSKDHAHTKVTKSNYDASVADDAAHIDYLKRDVLYDDKHGHNDEKMTADEKHISKLAGDMKYDKKHHGSAAKHINKFMDENHQHNNNHDERPLHSHKNFEKKKKKGSPAKNVEEKPHGTYADQGYIKSYKKGNKYVAIDKSEHNTYQDERIASSHALTKAKKKAREARKKNK